MLLDGTIVDLFRFISVVTFGGTNVDPFRSISPTRRHLVSIHVDVSEGVVIETVVVLEMSSLLS